MTALGFIRIAGWLLGGVTWQRVSDDPRLYHDYLCFGVDWFGDTLNQELVLPQQVVWVATNPAIMRATKRQLILGDYLRMTGQVQMVSRFATASDERRFETVWVKQRRGLAQSIAKWGAAYAAGTGKWRPIDAHFRQLASQFEAGRVTFEQLVAQIERLTVGNRDLQRPVHALIRRLTADAAAADKALQHIGHREFVLVPTQAKLLTQAQLVINPPAMPRESIRDVVFQHDWLVSVEAARRARLASGKPLITVTRRPIAGGKVWQSDGQLIPPNKEWSSWK